MHPLSMLLMGFASCPICLDSTSHSFSLKLQELTLEFVIHSLLSYKFANVVFKSCEYSSCKTYCVWFDLNVHWLELPHSTAAERQTNLILKFETVEVIGEYRQVWFNEM